MLNNGLGRPGLFSVWRSDKRESFFACFTAARLIDQAEPLRVIESQVIRRGSLPRSAKARLTKKRSRRSMGVSEQARLCRFAVDFVPAISPLELNLSTESKIDITTGSAF